MLILFASKRELVDIDGYDLDIYIQLFEDPTSILNPGKIFN